MSSLDVLAALARFAQHDGGATCFPEFVRDSPTPELDCKGLWHPALAATSTSPPIPTNLNIGSQSGAALLLTGPNMVGSPSKLRHVLLALTMFCRASSHILSACDAAQLPAASCLPAELLSCFQMHARSVLSGVYSFKLPPVHDGVMYLVLRRGGSRHCSGQQALQLFLRTSGLPCPPQHAA